ALSADQLSEGVPRAVARGGRQTTLVLNHHHTEVTSSEATSTLPPSPSPRGRAWSSVSTLRAIPEEEEVIDAERLRYLPPAGARDARTSSSASVHIFTRSAVRGRSCTMPLGGG